MLPKAPEIAPPEAATQVDPRSSYVTFTATYAALLLEALHALALAEEDKARLLRCFDPQTPSLAEGEYRKYEERFWGVMGRLPETAATARFRALLWGGLILAS